MASTVLHKGGHGVSTALISTARVDPLIVAASGICERNAHGGLFDSSDSLRVVNPSSAIQQRIEIYDENCPHNWRHGSGRCVSSAIPSGEGLCRTWAEAPVVIIQYRTDRGYLCRSPFEFGLIPSALWRSDRQHESHPHRAGDTAGRNLQLGCTKPRSGQF